MYEMVIMFANIFQTLYLGYPSYILTMIALTPDSHHVSNILHDF